MHYFFSINVSAIERYCNYEHLQQKNFSNGLIFFYKLNSAAIEQYSVNEHVQQKFVQTYYFFLYNIIPIER